MTVAESISWLLSHDDYLLLTHQRPDGDTLGSAAALCRALQRLGKTAWLFPNTQITENYIDYVRDYLAPEGYAHKCVIAVDIAEKKLFPIGYEGEADICFDHHPTNSHYAKHLVLAADCAACGELILQVIHELTDEIDRETADLLYIAISTDTGCFCYANTNANTFRAAAELLEAGADNASINKAIFRTVSAERLMLEGMIYASLRRFRDGTVNFAVVTLEMMQRSGATENDCDDLASLAGKVRGSRVSVTVRELEANRCKISVRTGKEVSAARICAQFEGGGHAMAAGCEIAADPDKAVEMLLQAINEEWK